MSAKLFFNTAVFLMFSLYLAAQQKPNIVVIWGDDLGVSNISAYHRGMLKPRTPNIDRIAKEGAIMTDAYAQQSCTAGRASFIMGQHPFRTGMPTIGMPGAKEGIRETDMTIANMLKGQGYATAQIGKNNRRIGYQWNFQSRILAADFYSGHRSA